MHINLKLISREPFQAVIPISYEKCFRPGNAQVPIAHVGPEARKALNPERVRVFTVQIERYEVLAPISAADVVTLTRLLNPQCFFDRELLWEALKADTMYETEFFAKDGSWNLVPIQSEEEPVMIGAMYTDAWKISRRRIRDETDTRGEDVPQGSSIILLS